MRYYFLNQLIIFIKLENSLKAFIVLLSRATWSLGHVVMVDWHLGGVNFVPHLVLSCAV